MKKRNRKPKHTLQQMQEIFKSRGCKLLETEYKNSKQILKFRCKCGEIRFKAYNNFYRYELNCVCKVVKDRSKMIKRKDLFCVSEVASIFGVEHNTIKRLIENEIIFSPTQKTKYYTEKDVVKISSILKGII